MDSTITKLVAGGESSTLELKRSTGELREALQTVCAFANGSGGRVIIGVRPDGEIVGQQIGDQTLHDLAAARERFEPPLEIEVETIEITPGRGLILLTIRGLSDSVPYTFDGRPFERVGNTTRRMAQETYESLLLQRAHSRRRWENQVADEISPRNLDGTEVRRIVDAARSTGRLVGPVGRNLLELLDRLGVRHKGHLLRAAVVLFGKTFLPDYPQCELRMARFRGTDKTEFLDQRNVRAPAFQLLEEAELFCQRHFPLPGRIEPGHLQRTDRPLIPPDAMREILVNAIIHRDYSVAGGAISLAIFDDRVEVWSAGRFPNGISPEALSRPHLSVQRNPIIAEVFHRAGLIEKWGRGTNRVADMCRAHRIPPPEFAEITGAAVVTLRTLAQSEPDMRSASHATDTDGSRVESRAESRAESGAESGAESRLATVELRVLVVLRPMEASKAVIAKALGLCRITGQLNRALRSLLKKGLVGQTIPDKPRSRLQKYRLTERGQRLLLASTTTRESR